MSERLENYVFAAALTEITRNQTAINQSYLNYEQTVGQINAHIQASVPTSAVEFVVKEFVRQGILLTINDDDAGTFYKLDMSAAVRFLSAQREKPDSLFFKYGMIGSQFLTSALARLQDGETIPERLPLESGIAPASNRLVTFDHNSQQTIDLIEITEEAGESIRSSNSIDEEKRGWIRAHIEAGIEFIRNNRKMLVGAAAYLLLEPLQAAYEAVAEEPAKAAILVAINTVRAFFGI